MLKHNSNLDHLILPVSDIADLVEKICEEGSFTCAPYLYPLFTSIHAENVKAGWWSDLATGERKQRNFGELSALVWSEIGEAITAEGPDDKLPQYHGQMVEIADALIRQADLFGSEMLGSSIDAASLVEDALYTRRPSGQNVASPRCLTHWLNFFEAGRRGQDTALAHFAGLFAYLIRCGQVLYVTQQHTAVIAGITVAPLWEVLAAKIAFNRSRADHKVENRKAEGGKKI